VYAREVGCRIEVKEPIDWMLLTSVKTESFEDARERLKLVQPALGNRSLSSHDQERMPH